MLSWFAKRDVQNSLTLPLNHSLAHSLTLSPTLTIAITHSLSRLAPRRSERFDPARARRGFTLRCQNARRATAKGIRLTHGARHNESDSIYSGRPRLPQNLHTCSKVLRLPRVLQEKLKSDTKLYSAAPVPRRKRATNSNRPKDCATRSNIDTFTTRVEK